MHSQNHIKFAEVLVFDPSIYDPFKVSAAAVEKINVI